MSKLDFDTSKEQLLSDLNSLTSLEVKQLMANLQHSNALRYKLINLEMWALAGTMDHFLPGFWSRFLTNRRTALKQFLKNKHSNESQGAD